MPIKGLTCLETRSAGAMTVLGKLRKGAAKQGNRPGADLDHFRFDTSDRALAQIFEGIYGAKPGSSYENGIRFFFPSADFEQCMPTMKAAYKGGSCYVLCDGESIYGERVDVDTKEGSRWVNHATHRRPNCRFPKCLGNESCGATGKLRILIPELQRFGVVDVVVGALNDLEHVSKQVAEIQEKVTQHGADLSMVPLILYRQSRAISTPASVDKNGQRSAKRARREKSLIEVDIAPEFFSKAIAARNNYALASASTLSLPGSAPALPQVQAALPSTESWQDEFGQRVDTRFKDSDLWRNIKRAFQSCRDVDTVRKYHDAGIQKIKSDELPMAAARSLEVLAKNAKQRIEEMDLKPFPVDVEIVPEPSVLERFDAIARRVNITMQQVEAAAKQVKLQTKDITQWSEEDCQLLRDRIYAFCDVAVKTFESTDAAGAEYQAFMQQQSVDFSDDGVVWEAWSAIANG